jgi:hypothetical protein
MRGYGGYRRKEWNGGGRDGGGERETGRYGEWQHVLDDHV